ncbi:hypothetical protein SBOR_2506 [Sclerotinia borealis F-4128]|uniref:Ima1 N-terminal domain-containing protein n=1 Tax=Sclerotinia borealis (strain F-4128) TaxID=1432307 RepID=W9CMK5_SCLBF|nr:hypothetical protein SBOR_2506 [Sclerotinia borealis F-4128]
MFFSKRLVCFYCGQKSGHKFDGSLSQFDCDSCQARNYLDQNGDITDPPVSITETTSNNQFAYSSDSSHTIKSPIFCERCLFNQQYQYDILKQFNVQFDSRHPEYQIGEEKIRIAKIDLDKRYPMVCEECAPKAQEQRDKADKFAKSDWLGRLNALSELIRRQKTWKDTFQNVIYQTLLYPIVSKVWYIVVIGQIITLIMALFNATNILDKTLNFVPYLSADLILKITSFFASKKDLGWGILCNFLSCGMNPFFSRWYPRGNTRRVSGFFNWYGYQLLLQLVLRALVYSIFESGRFTYLSSFSTMIVNICTIFFNIIIVYGSRFYLGPKKISLWKSTPGPIFSPLKFETSEKPSNTMAGILDEIMAPTPKADQLSPSPPTNHAQRSSPKNQERPDHRAYQNQTFGFREKTSTETYDPNYNRRYEIPKQTELLLRTDTSGLNPAEISHYLATGERPEWKIQEGEEMDWDHTITRVKHDFKIRNRALDTVTNSETQVQPFGQSSPFLQSPTSFDGPSPFYGKLPAAPISPAHRLRNPPNRPRLDVPSAQKKENFFNSMTQKPAFGKANANHHEMHIAEQKLHIPNPAAYRLDPDFAEAFGKFSLTEEPDMPNKESGKLSMGRAMGLSLLLGGLALGAGAYYKSKSALQDETFLSPDAVELKNTSTS